jgi:hypothetical protein
MNETDKKPSEWVLITLYNLSAALTHILGADNLRPVSWWAWRVGSRMVQYAFLALPISLPLWIAFGGPFWNYWVLAFSGIWLTQIETIIWRIINLLWRRK